MLKAKIGDRILLLNGMYSDCGIPREVIVRGLYDPTDGQEICMFENPKDGKLLCIADKDYEVISTDKIAERTAPGTDVKNIEKGNPVEDFEVQQSIRQFESGATRDTDQNKPDYEGFLSPLVIERYGQYMNKHRKQAGGKLRDSDNWQKGIPLNVYMKSAWRHFVDWWKFHRGLALNKTTPSDEDLEDSICALIFNASGYLHELLKEKNNV